MNILGVSGSPIKDSNTDRAIKKVLEATGMPSKFIKLRDYTFEPCRACLGCLDTNECIIGDDGNTLAEEARAADAMVVGGYTPYSYLDARTKAFLERLYPLRHKHGFMRGKPGAAVVTAAIPETCEHLPRAASNGVETIKAYMIEEGMTFVGEVKCQGNLPCIKCGHSNQCMLSGISMLFGDEATADTLDVHDFELKPQVIATAEETGRKIAEVLG